jgi:hypothetical protein
MKGQMAAMMTGVVLVMSAATLPASAYVSHTSPQPLLGEQQQTQMLGKKSAQEQQKWILQKWSLDEQGVKVGQLTSADRTKYQQFKAGIEQGLDPLAAAKQARASFIKLESTGQRQLHLSLSKKAYAIVQLDIQSKVLKVLQVGSGVKPLQTLSKSTTARYQKRTTPGNQTRPSLVKKTSAPLRVNGQSKVVKANPAGNNVKPVPTSSQNQPVLPR